MSRKRFIAPWKDSLTKPAIYHCISRVVDRQFVFEAAERERFRMFSKRSTEGHRELLAAGA